MSNNSVVRRVSVLARRLCTLCACSIAAALVSQSKPVPGPAGFQALLGGWQGSFACHVPEAWWLRSRS